MNKVVTYVTNSKNSKIGKMDCTYAPIDNTCPSTCQLKDKECFARTSFTGIINARLGQAAFGLTALQLAREESRAIRQSYKGGKVPNIYLRMHVSGDSKTIKGSRSLNAACKDWVSRGGKKVYSYTHAWRNVSKSVWRDVSMLASLDSPNEAKQAREQGYAPALTVAEFSSDKAFKIDKCDVTWIPCPAQTKENVSCVSCNLCMRADWLFENKKGIAFAAHGVSKNSLKRRLKII